MSSRYSETIMEHFMEPRNRGRLDHPSGVGLSGTPGQGPFIVFQILSDEGHIEQARFQCHNCGVTVACGSVLTELSIHKTLAECNLITQQMLADELDGVPPDKMHMVSFVLDAFKAAIREASQ